jgi:hypothetical protein
VPNSGIVLLYTPQTTNHTLLHTTQVPQGLIDIESGFYYTPRRKNQKSFYEANMREISNFALQYRFSWKSEREVKPCGEPEHGQNASL